MTTRFRATTTLDVYRDNSGLPASGSFDGYDDDAESGTPMHAGLPADVTQRTSNTLDPVTGRVTVVERWRARLRPGADVKISDRILDSRTGHRFVVDLVIAPAGATGTADVRLEMTRISR